MVSSLILTGEIQMCGIAGIFSYKNKAVDQSILEKMNERLVHRGPDAGDTWLSDDARIGFAHRRLSIIDLSAKASQPMTSVDGNLCIVFNGEIYNHAALRQELTALGHQKWKTSHSDTKCF